MATGLERMCPACDATDFEFVVGFEEIPFSGRFRADNRESLPVSNLRHELCINCGLVRQWPVAHFTDYVKVGRPTSRQLPCYVSSLLDGIRAAYPVDTPYSSILEVGCNDGAFMSALRHRGFRNIMGVEPSLPLGEYAVARGFEVIIDYFGSAVVERLREQRRSFQMVVCRHTLEHVPDPLEFVVALRTVLAEGGGLMLEVPDGDAIPDLMNVYEFWDEHLFIFSMPSLTALLRRAGFAVERMEVVPHLDTRNIIVWARAVTADSRYGNDCGESSVPRWLRFADAWPKYKERLYAAVHSAPRPVYMVGASHVQCNFANYLGIGQLIDFMVDDDPNKIGLLAGLRGGAPTVIGSATFLRDASVGSLLRTGFGYTAWMDRLTDRARGCGMRIIDPNDYKGLS